MSIKSIILAAGKGTRMGSDQPKVSHLLAGKPLVHYVIETAMAIGSDDIYLVVGHQAETVKDITSKFPLNYVHQHEQLGTGHAVIQAAPFFPIEAESDVIILSGDCPLTSKETLQELVQHHQNQQSLGTVLTTKLDDPGHYGRILRDENGQFVAIREAKDCNDNEKNVQEINSGIYCFNSNALFYMLKKLNTSNSQNEYYLTDVLELLHQSQKTISAYCTPKQHEILGVNTPKDLQLLEDVLIKVQQT